jgi:hypothetical protein
MEDFRTLGKQFGVEYAETFRYIGPQGDHRSAVRKYVDENAVAL